MREHSKIYHTKHGKCGTPEWRTWRHMKDRCLNPNNKDWRYYGGRGVGICDSWSNFSSFYADMGEKPFPKGLYSLDRINNELGYSPNNCRWATRIEQARNRLGVKTCSAA